jgi:hypothetical protein
MEPHCINVVERRTFLEVVEAFDETIGMKPRKRAYSDTEIDYSESQFDDDDELCSTSSGGTADYESSCSWSNNDEEITDASVQPSTNFSMLWVPILVPAMPPCVASSCPVPLESSLQFSGNCAPTLCDFSLGEFAPGNFTPGEFAPGEWQISEGSEREVHHSKVSNTFRMPREEAMANRKSTTIIIRGLHSDITREALTSIFDAEGFSGAYDFVYVPVHFQAHDGTNLGYALINLVDHVMAKAFMHHLTESKLPCFDDCEASFSDTIQGQSALIERYRDSAVMHNSVSPDHQPAIYRRGRMVPFPEPTKKIRAPRIRHRKAEDAA